MVGLESRQILVVDDNVTNHQILQSQLEQWHLVPTLAESGQQALALLFQRSDFIWSLPICRCRRWTGCNWLSRSASSTPGCR